LTDDSAWLLRKAEAMTPQELRDRVDRFAVDIVVFCRQLPNDNLARRLAGQLQDAGTSVAANYRAACRARSRAEFVAKLSIAVEEADESVELPSILSASRKTASGRRRRT
jgi:four helix bundle protein